MQAVPRDSHDFRISLLGAGGVDRILRGHRRDRRQPMRGFDDTYSDIVDYIVRITHRIWEVGDVGYIYDTYATNVVVTDGSGRKADREQMVVETVSALAAFPDLRLNADEVIWAGDDNAGFRTSHRVVSVGHHTGSSELGAPTGRRVSAWGLANCVCLENRIVEEWLQDNTGLVLLQLGRSPIAAARATAADLAVDPLPYLDDDVTRVRGQLAGVPAPDPDHFDIEQFVRFLGHRLWNRRDLSAVGWAYAPTIRFHGPTGRELYGRGEVKAFVSSLLVGFPDLAYRVDEVYSMGSDDVGFALSVRWSAVGTHRGHGVYGPPTGRRAHLWGISQLHVYGQRIVEEWTLFNEFELMQSLFRPVRSDGDLQPVEETK